MTLEPIDAGSMPIAIKARVVVQRYWLLKFRIHVIAALFDVIWWVAGEKGGAIITAEGEG